MTRKDYELIADFLGLECRTIGSPSPEAIEAMSIRLGRRLREDNPNFRQDRFTARIQDVASGKRKVL
jgi:hypothetical protein